MSMYEAHLPLSSPATIEALLGTYDIARAQQGQHTEALPHIGQIVLKTVAGCNFDCQSADDGFGYDCYEYVTDDWRNRPPVMTDEVAWQTGVAMGTYAAQRNLQKRVGTIHGGEPLFVPKDPERPQQKPHDYYDRILPLIRRAMHEVAPQTALAFTMQTNGSLLQPNNLSMLKRHGVRTSVSLDGPAAIHNGSRVIMHNGRRIGTYNLVERGLRRLAQEEYADIYGGIICVIDVRSDPQEVLAELRKYNPPHVDLHLPYGTWQNMPPALRDHPLRGRAVVEALGVYRLWVAAGHSPRSIDQMLTDCTTGEIQQQSAKARQLFERTRTADPHDVQSILPYAAWLRTFYEANKQLEKPLNVRFFRSIEQMVLGGHSKTEAIGPRAGGEIVVRTDGSIELPDSLRVARSDIEKTEFTVFENTLEEVAEELRAQHHLGRKSVASVCSTCAVQPICGGGHIASRYSEERGFDNPSVYCPDLEDVIRAIRKATLDTQTPAISLIKKRRQAAEAIEDEARRALVPYVVSPDLEVCW